MDPALELVTDCLEKQDSAQGAVYVWPGVEECWQRRDLIKLRSSQLNLRVLGKVSEWNDPSGKLAPEEQGGQGREGACHANLFLGGRHLRHNNDLG